MRLICPNCDAQYEVDDAAIPLTGRDVQCSSCGHAWFQLHPAEAAEPDLEEAVAEPIYSAPDDLLATATEDDSAEQGLKADPGTEEDVPSDASEAEVQTIEPVPQRRAVDDSVLAVLREEAAREAAVRRAEAPPVMEMQSDLGLAPPPLPAVLPPSVLAARERFAELSVDAADSAEEEIVPRPASRRELLPDIEEINSTLRASSEPRDGADADQAYQSEVADRRGFRTGFGLVVLLAVLMWAAYATAPRIVAALPASDGIVTAYVAAVDRARLGMDAALQSASRSLRSLSGLDG